VAHHTTKITPPAQRALPRSSGAAESANQAHSKAGTRALASVSDASLGNIAPRAFAGPLGESRCALVRGSVRNSTTPLQRLVVWRVWAAPDFAPTRNVPGLQGTESRGNCSRGRKGCAVQRFRCVGLCRRSLVWASLLGQHANTGVAVDAAARLGAGASAPHV
jgi:hypothetical protein